MFTAFSVWCVIALIVLGVEMISTTIYLLAIFVGAIVGACSALLGLSLQMQCYLSSIAICIAAILCYFLRKKLKQQKDKSNNNLDIGEIVIIKDKKDHSYSSNYRGTNWQVREENNQDLKVNDKVKIKKIEGITLIVEKID